MRRKKTRRRNTSVPQKALDAYANALGNGQEVDADLVEQYCRRVCDDKIIDPVLAYAKLVVGGQIVAGPHVRNACQRHIHDLKVGAKRGLRWDVAAALRAIMFFPEVLRLNGGQFEGIPFRLHPSQAFRVGSLFGWKRAVGGKRRFRRFYDEEGKGSGKSPMLAGIGMYCMLADNEQRAEIYAAASKKDQAMVLFRDAVAMRQQSPALAERLIPSGINPVWNLADPETKSFFRPISDDDGKSGPRPSCALCDEVHEHRTGDTIEMLERGFKWREQPLLVMATNSGSDRNSICWREHEHAIRVAAGTKTPGDDGTYVGDLEFAAQPACDSEFSYVCALDKGDDPLEDSRCWAKTNPLLGITMTEEKIAAAVSQAKAIPGKLNGILRLHFCVWTDAEMAWMGRATLDSVMANFEPSQHAGKRVFIGADLSGAQDLTALGFCVPTGTVKIERSGIQVEMPTYDAWVEAWTPKDTLAERSLRDQAPYEVWAQGGWLNAVPGRNIRLDFVAARIAEVNAEYQVGLLAYDRYAYRKLEEELDAQGLTLPLAEHPQGGVRRAKLTSEQLDAAKLTGEETPLGLWMPGSVLALETLILERRIRIRRSPVLMSAMMSAAVEHDPFDNRWFSKRRAVNRIDALVALTMAVGAADAAPVVEGPAYEGRDILII
jgi:phage terminase large subunit-like protein